MIDPWSKPATSLIENVSRAVGGIASPWQIKRVAAADAQASVLRAEGEAKAMEITKRAELRVARLEERRQENIEDITFQAASLIGDDAPPSEIDQDWLIYFFNSCQDTSDDEMKIIWSKLLSEEFKHPGNFSKRTIFRISQLTKREANDFTFVCSHIFDVNGKPELLLHQERVNETIGIGRANQLASVGLLNFELLITVSSSKQEFVISHKNQQGTIRGLENSFDPLSGSKHQSPSYWIEVGNFELTDSGKELHRICGAKPTNEIFERTLELTETINRPGLIEF